METGYVLINCTPGKTSEVYKKLKDIPAVVHVEMILGPWDLLATVQGSDVSYIGVIVGEKIQKLAGVEKTTTCIAIKVDEAQLGGLIY
uniref:Lrp/AsnC family transcriptional regulator n=1 Tax=candidate division WOR-3 bacterium TaxID=2052148 RepID=A0A7C6E9D6_UNCW3